MGLSLYLDKEECPTCGHKEEIFEGNYTYNVSAMWYTIYPDDKGMVYIDGLTGKESIQKLQDAIEELENNSEFFDNLNPPNNFGSREGFVTYLKNCLNHATLYPDATWKSWR